MEVMPVVCEIETGGQARQKFIACHVARRLNPNSWMEQKNKSQRYFYKLLHRSLNLELMRNPGTTSDSFKYFQLPAPKIPSLKRKLIITFHEVGVYIKWISNIY